MKVLLSALTILVSMSSVSQAGVKAEVAKKILSAKPGQLIKLSIIPNYHPNNIALNLKKGALETKNEVSNGATKSKVKIVEDASKASSLTASVESYRYVPGEDIKTFVNLTLDQADDVSGTIFKTLNADIIKSKKARAHSNYDGKISFTIKMEKLDKANLDFISSLVKKAHQMILAEKSAAEPTLQLSRKTALVQTTK